MKIRFIYLLGVICLITAFWACVDGDVYYPETDDLVAVEKFEKISKKDLDAMMDSCLEDSECLANWDTTLGRPVWNTSTKSSSSHKRHATSSSSSKESGDSKEESSSSKAKSSSSEGKSSSSSKVSSSSSEEPSGGDSSDDKPEPDSSDESSSSEPEGESSSSEDSSSSEPEGESSSDEDLPEESSSSITALPPSGTCRPDKNEAKIGEPVTWTYYPDEGTLNNGYKWFMDQDAKAYHGSSQTGNGPAQPYTVYYEDAGDKTLTEIRIGGNKPNVPCGASAILTITNEVYVDTSISSSSEEVPPIEYTSSSYSSSSGNGGGDTPGPSL